VTIKVLVGYVARHQTVYILLQRNFGPDFVHSICISNCRRLYFSDL